MRGLDMSTLMLPAATMTTMSNTGPIPVSQAKMDPVKSGLLLNNNNILNSKQQLQQGRTQGPPSPPPPPSYVAFFGCMFPI
jgi:hypothetical protein